MRGPRSPSSIAPRLKLSFPIMEAGLRVCKANHNKEETVVAQCTHNHCRAQGTIYTHDIASSAVGGVEVADTSSTPKVAAKKY